MLQYLEQIISAKYIFKEDVRYLFYYILGFRTQRVSIGTLIAKLAK